jgi:tRNA 2-thiouridine synthesizing protein E
MTEANNGAEFPFAPDSWSTGEATDMAAAEGLAVSPDHWEAMRALQEFYSRHESSRINSRELRDALDERFHERGGMKYLYDLFPGGPVAQGCRLAGLEAPAGSNDPGFGSVM